MIELRRQPGGDEFAEDVERFLFFSLILRQNDDGIRGGDDVDELSPVSACIKEVKLP